MTFVQDNPEGHERRLEAEMGVERALIALDMAVLCYEVRAEIIEREAIKLRDRITCVNILGSCVETID